MLVTLLSAAPLTAFAQTRIVPEQPASAQAARGGVDVFVVNEGDADETMTLPDELSVTAANGETLTLHAPDALPSGVAARGFVRVRYTLAGPATPPPAVASAPPPPDRESGVMSATGHHDGLLSRLEPHDPVYGVAGAGDAGAKLQFSFAVRPFEGAGVLDGLRFGYTQTMFWAIDRKSAPFRSTTYSPEIYYEIAPEDTVRIAAGYHHDSNGGGPATSVDINRFFVRAAKRFDIGHDWYAEVAPEAWLYYSTKHPRGSIKRYLGYTGLRLAVGQEDGIKFAGHLTGNPGTGKAAGELFVSYPLTRIDDSIGIYMFGQLYSGYGESLEDYDRSDSHARIGISFTR
ncbi:phospholipase A [Stakelama sp. CBK3Z-3]|uniref:Phospholipase A1 n=1 Tax=Stakelama flava TaxID=2860338 RepID=A0ABS6XIF3_9SPHN|nr:phospholipase A [Stakelama flava]MBW4329993.1 phospholipase A [Stakelama flava]